MSGTAWVLCKLCHGAGSLAVFGQKYRAFTTYHACPACTGFGCFDAQLTTPKEPRA